MLVVGDVMLDRYWFGDVSRISPEAPVPVVLINKEDQRLGGAANVAWNCRELGARTRLLSVVGKDEPGRALEKLLKENRIEASLHRDGGLNTTQKLRVIARHQQLIRIDFERPPSREVLASKLEEFKRALAETDVVILSDYGKGGLTHIAEMIRAARRAKKRVLIDPKGDDYARYKGASIITPNTAELREVVGTWKDEKDLKARAQALAAKLGLEALLLTRGEVGMSLFAKNQNHDHQGRSAGSLRRHRRRRHGDRHARRDARRRREARGRGAHREPRGRHRGRQARHRGRHAPGAVRETMSAKR